MRRALALVVLLFLATACTIGSQREKQAILDEVARAKLAEQRAWEELVVDIERYARSNALMGKTWPLDVERFIEWRKRELWHLREALASSMIYEWQNVERLTRDVGRYYGYNIVNFPRAKNDVLRFFHHADAEWRNLVVDAMIFFEYKNRELYKMEDDLRRFYDKSAWEAANLQIDVASFIEWRNREYNKLIKDGRDWFAYAEEDAPPARGRRALPHACRDREQAHDRRLRHADGERAGDGAAPDRRRVSRDPVQ